MKLIFEICINRARVDYYELGYKGKRKGMGRHVQTKVVSQAGKRWDYLVVEDEVSRGQMSVIYRLGEGIVSVETVNALKTRLDRHL